MKDILKYGAYRTAARSGLEVDFSVPEMRGVYHDGDEYLNPPVMLTAEGQCGEFCRITLPVPVVPSFAVRGGHLARLLDISDAELADILKYRLALTPRGLIHRSELGDLAYDAENLYGGAAIERMLEGVDLAELEYELGRTLLNEPSHPDRDRLSARLDAVRELVGAGIDTGFFLTRVLPLPIEIQKIAQSEEMDLTDYELSDRAFRLWRRVAHAERIERMDAPPIIMHNEHRMVAEAADAYLAAVERYGIRLSSPSYALTAVMNNLRAGSRLDIEGDVGRLTLPIYFKDSEERPTFTLTVEGAGYRISDGGFATEHLRLCAGARADSLTEAVGRIAEEYELEVEGDVVSGHLPGLANPVAMVRRLSSYISAITLIGHLHILG